MKCIALLSLGTIVLISGCEKLPEFPVGEKKPQTNDTQQDEAPSTQPEKSTTEDAKPIVLTPEQVIAQFQAKETTQLTETDVLELAALESGIDQIQELDLKGSRLSPAAMTALAKFTGLKKLNLQSAAFAGGNLEAISGLPSLEWLDLSRTSANNREMEHVAKISTLKVLKLAQTVINDDGMALFTNLSALQELDISSTETVGIGLAALGNDGAKAPLRILNASHTRVGTQGFRFVNQFSLEELHVSKAMVTDLSLEGLRGCNQLEVMNLANNLITDKSAKWLITSKALQELDLSRNPGIRDGALRKLQTLPELSKLNLSKTAASAKAIQALKQRLPNCAVIINEGVQ